MRYEMPINTLDIISILIGVLYHHHKLYIYIYQTTHWVENKFDEQNLKKWSSINSLHKQIN